MLNETQFDKNTFITGTGKEIALNDIPNAMLDFYTATKAFDTDYNIIIGTDSQNHSKTKIVTVCCITCAGHGGRFFYQITNEDIIRDVRKKLQVETNESLILATKLVDLLENNEKYEEMYLDCPMSIHVDAGNSVKGKTRELIPEIVGWVKSCGYDVKIKPDSFVSSSIADRISK